MLKQVQPPTIEPLNIHPRAVNYVTSGFKGSYSGLIRTLFLLVSLVEEFTRAIFEESFGFNCVLSNNDLREVVSKTSLCE